jgi:outer membrane murein-binding lipoprotein Lpp
VISELESQLQECHTHLEQAMSTIQQAQKQESLCVELLTNIAQVFEKKPVEGKYSLQLLLDFVLDKSKRAVAKLEEVRQKPEKHSSKIDELDSDVQNLRRL